MKFFLTVLLISSAQASIAPPNKIRLQPSKSVIIGVKSAQLIELKFKLADPGKIKFKPYYESEHERLAEELSQFITN